MIGEFVDHPQYGRGQITAIFRNGSEWMVRFESGMRFRRPRHEFNGQQEPSVISTAIAPIPAMPPMTRSQFEARQLVEALRVGIAPVQHLRELTIGLVSERASLTSGLNRAHQNGGAVRAVVGDYGFGKSHIVELVIQEALERDFIVANANLDLVELPPHKGLDVYGGLLRNLRYAHTDERGLEPLVERALESSRARQQMSDLATVKPNPLALLLDVFQNKLTNRQRQAWIQWSLGGRRTEPMSKHLPKEIKLPTLYRMGNHARQLAYLLNGVSVLARLAGFNGLCILIDEAECYSLLTKRQQEKADQFFRALIYSSLQATQTHIQPDDLPQHHLREYPLNYGGRQSLFFLFTVTRSDNRMPIESWLDSDHILELDPHHTAQELGQFLQQIMGYHAQAYGYEPGDRQGQIRRGAAEILAMGMRTNTLSIRGIVRLAVELFDLLYLYPNYSAAALLDELRAVATG